MCMMDEDGVVSFCLKNSTATLMLSVYNGIGNGNSIDVTTNEQQQIVAILKANVKSNG